MSPEDQYNDQTDVPVATDDRQPRPHSERGQGRPKGSTNLTKRRNAVYTDGLRDEYHDPMITFLCMTIPDEEDKRKLPWDAEKADALLKACKFFHHVRGPIKTDGTDSDLKGGKKIVNVIVGALPKDDPSVRAKIINGSGEELEDE